MAKFDYWGNIEYLDKNWSSREVSQFIAKTEHILNMLGNGNVSFKPAVYLDILQVPIVPQIILFYRINENKIELVRFWNTSQDFSNIKF